MKNDLNEYKKILSNVLSLHTVKINFENLEIRTLDEIVEMICYKTIQRIRKVLNNDKLNDFECIERIGSNGGSRHDF